MESNYISQLQYFTVVKYSFEVVLLYFMHLVQ